MAERDFNLLHVIAADTPLQRLDTLRMLHAQAELGRQRIIQLGSRCLDCPRLGTGELVHVRAVLGRLARPSLRDLLPTAGPTIVHVWSERALPWVSQLADVRLMIDVEQPHVLPGLVARLPRLCSNARTGFVCPTESARQRLRAIGVPFTACTLIRDPVGASAVKRGNRAELRRELDISEEHIAVLILPPVRRATGALVAAWGAMLLEHTRPGVCLILPDAGREVARVARLVESCRLRRMLRRVGWRFSLSELLAATDLAVYAPTGDAPLWGVAQAMAAGRPIIASDVRIARELLTHGRTAWLCRANDPKDTCRRMLRALEDREQSERVGEAARAHAHAAFDRRRALGQYRRAYLNLLADRPVGGSLADVVLVR